MLQVNEVVLTILEEMLVSAEMGDLEALAARIFPAQNKQEKHAKINCMVSTKPIKQNFKRFSKDILTNFQ